MRAASTVTAIGFALWLTAPAVHALGFGRVVNATQLGQPLNFAASVRLDTDETLARECVTAEVFVGDNRLQPNQVRATLEPSAEPNERSVRVTTSALIDEPVVTVNITLGCGARMTRKFVAFIDPPLINLAQGGAAAEPPPTLPPQRVDSQVAPLADIVQGDSRGAAASAPRSGMRVPERPSRPRALAVGPASRRAARDAVTPPRPAAERRPAERMAGAARPATRGPRLQLEAAPSLAARVAAAASMPSTSAAASPPAASAAPAGADAAANALLVAAAASAASAADAAGQQLAKERARLQALESSIAQLRAEAQASQKALVALQTRINNQTQSERYANPLVYALAWLSALLAAAVAALWWRQSRKQGAAPWWNPQANAAEGERVRGRSVFHDAVSVPQALPTGPDVASASHVASSAYESPTSVSVAAPIAPGPAAQPPQGEARELSVEELIDLEQQAEFFIVLGQDDAAIELLMSHVRGSGGTSPLPYLKLLEIYRRRGESDAYQRIRERFNRRFNAYAPDWDSDLQQGRSLEDYPEVMQQLASLWSGPERTMEHLDGLLFRRKQDDQTFDVPAYRELLFLYSIQRDHAEQEASRPGADVDLLLPIGESEDGPISQLMTATGALDMRVAPTRPADVDVSLPGGPGAAAGMRRFASESGFIDLDDPGPGAPRKR